VLADSASAGHWPPRFQKLRLNYTWNLKHFRAIRPEAADRIRTP
jgi:hypothetical protein